MTSAPTFAIRKGPRNYQEDFHLLKRIDGIDFFGWLLIVADGHGGAAVAKLCVQEAGSFLHPIKAK
jgi:serine/threonine protein phosphatase PrpC